MNGYVELTGHEPVRVCPKCGARVFEGEMRYFCENTMGSRKTCDLEIAKVILQQTIDREQVKKLLWQRKTDLLPRFVSKKGRPFSARLAIQEDGKVVFEFELGKV